MDFLLSADNFSTHYQAVVLQQLQSEQRGEVTTRGSSHQQCYEPRALNAVPNSASEPSVTGSATSCSGQSVEGSTSTSVTSQDSVGVTQADSFETQCRSEKAQLEVKAHNVPATCQNAKAQPLADAVQQNLPLFQKSCRSADNSTHIPTQKTELGQISSTKPVELDFITCSISDIQWEDGPFEKDFQEDPAHKYWKWDKKAERWFHQEGESMIWCPDELD